MATVKPQERLKKELKQAGISLDFARIEKALKDAQAAYEGHEHWTGMSTLEHVLAVLSELLPYQPDEDTVIACLLHHVLQVNYWTLAELESKWGPKIRELVAGVHLLSKVTLNQKRYSIDDLRLMLLSVSDDVRTVLIILSDRLAVLKHLQQADRDRARRNATSVLQLYAPVAARLGMYNLKNALEAKAFPLSYPNDAKRITDQLKRLRGEFGEFITGAADQLKKNIVDQLGIKVKIVQREKQPFSTFRKMQNKSLSDALKVTDLFAIRVIVPTETDCYRVLGVLHKIGRPVPNRFKDYIAFPKPNGYRSLHTTLAYVPGVPEDILLEVQVRSTEMHREAEYGIAAHWMYKEAGSAEQAVQRLELHNVLASQQSLADESTSVLADHIYVLTPGGDLIELPEGSTPLDFAFQIHTEVGLSFKSARVNGSIVPADYVLENGDMVDIQRHRTPQPSPQWLNIVKTSSARSKLKRHLYAQNRDEYVVRGREAVNNELARHSLPGLDTDLSVMRRYEGRILTRTEREDILHKIGQESEKASALLPKLDDLEGKLTVTKAPKRAKKAQDEIDLAPDTSLTVKMLTTEDGLSMPMRFAKCCQPENAPVSPMMGVVNRGGKVIVHRKSCGNLKHANAERQVRVLVDKLSD